MDTRHMRYFVALAETLHFGQAAARMNMSQPPFSRQIASIEKTLGVRLFERNSRNVALTPAGRHFLNDCRSTLAAFEAACQDAQLVARGVKGELRLGFTMYAAHGIVPSLVRRFSEVRPDVHLILEERIPTELDEMLLEGRLDAVVTFGVDYRPRLQSVLLCRDRLQLVVPAGHSLASADNIGAKQLQGEKLIAAPASVAPTLRSAIAIYLAESGVVPYFGFEPRLQQTIIQLVAEGLGIALVPQSIAAQLPPGAVSKPLRDAPEFDVVLCAPVSSKSPVVPSLFDVATNTFAI
jgi:DNA-binding transcriptional LysR family regulator